MNKKLQEKSSKKLSVRQQKFVSEVIKGNTKTTAYKKVYKPQTVNQNSIHRQASKVSRNGLVAQAIENALEANQLTPELAVKELKKIVVQDEELGAKRLAIKDSLELHGWQRGDKPTITLDIQNASFFNSARKHSTEDA